MARHTIEHTRLSEGVWHIDLNSDAPRPSLTAYYKNTALQQIEIAPSGTPALWRVKVPLPPEVLSDGVHTVLLCADGQEDTPLSHLTVMAGEIIGDDMRAEVTLLRAELDLLKSAFRRHCRDT
ncbi:MAG: hypothetical protein AB8B58_01005 [Roseobacter sp.]